MDASESPEDDEDEGGKKRACPDSTSIMGTGDKEYEGLNRTGYDGMGLASEVVFRSVTGGITAEGLET